jgi:hypothetical protein
MRHNFPAGRLYLYYRAGDFSRDCNSSSQSCYTATSTKIKREKAAIYHCIALHRSLIFQYANISLATVY